MLDLIRGDTIVKCQGTINANEGSWLSTAYCIGG